jgi:putative lipoic acid-binding regulatory protein
MKKLLNETHEWPHDYTFKFIFRDGSGIRKRIEEEIPDIKEVDIRSSRNNKWKSMHFKYRVKNADQVLEIYDKIQKIEGVMAL